MFFYENEFWKFIQIFLLDYFVYFISDNLSMKEKIIQMIFTYYFTIYYFII